VIKVIRTQEALDTSLSIVATDLDSEFIDSPASTVRRRTSSSSSHRASFSAAQAPAGKNVITAVKIVSKNMAISGDAGGCVRAFSLKDGSQMWKAIPDFLAEDGSALKSRCK
jgi:hypothetical protein